MFCDSWASTRACKSSGQSGNRRELDHGHGPTRPRGPAQGGEARPDCGGADRGYWSEQKHCTAAPHRVRAGRRCRPRQRPADGCGQARDGMGAVISRRRCAADRHAHGGFPHHDTRWRSFRFCPSCAVQLAPDFAEGAMIFERTGTFTAERPAGISFTSCQRMRRQRA